MLFHFENRQVFLPHPVLSQELPIFRSSNEPMTFHLRVRLLSCYLSWQIHQVHCVSFKVLVDSSRGTGTAVSKDNLNICPINDICFFHFCDCTCTSDKTKPMNASKCIWIRHANLAVNKFSPAPIQTDFEASKLQGIFPRDKAAGARFWPSTPNSARIKEKVKLYLYYPTGPSWPALGWIFTSKEESLNPILLFFSYIYKIQRISVLNWIINTIYSVPRWSLFGVSVQHLSTCYYQITWLSMHVI
jgi:hypothetical protein